MNTYKNNTPQGQKINICAGPLGGDPRALSVSATPGVLTTTYNNSEALPPDDVKNVANGAHCTNGTIARDGAKRTDAQKALFSWQK